MAKAIKTVGDLIDELKRYPPELLVYMRHEVGWETNEGTHLFGLAERIIDRLLRLRTCVLLDSVDRDRTGIKVERQKHGEVERVQD